MELLELWYLFAFPDPQTTVVPLGHLILTHFAILLPIFGDPMGHPILTHFAGPGLILVSENGTNVDVERQINTVALIVPCISIYGQFSQTGPIWGAQSQYLVTQFFRCLKIL